MELHVWRLFKLGLFKWIKKLFSPKLYVRCVDCGRVLDVNSESHYWWNEKYGHGHKEERTLVQCVNCAQTEEMSSDDVFIEVIKRVKQTNDN